MEIIQIENQSSILYLLFMSIFRQKFAKLRKKHAFWQSFSKKKVLIKDKNGTPNNTKGRETLIFENPPTGSGNFCIFSIQVW